MDIPTSPMPAPPVPIPAPMPPPVPSISVMPTIPKKKGSSVWITVAIVVVLIAAYGAYAYFSGMWPFVPSGTSPFETSTPVASATPDTTGWQTYTNTDYGFSFKLPKSWDGYQATASKYSNWHSLCFSVPHVGDQGFCLLQLIVYTPAQWVAFTDANARSTKPLAQNDSYVIVAEYSLEGGGGQYSQFQIDRSAEIPAILSTFKLTE